jgi:uncharacterized protein with HEPN domain
MRSQTFRFRLDDIVVEIATVTQVLAGQNFESYCRDRPTRRTVERCIEIISEASRHIPDEVTAGFPGVPWRNIRGIGNVLRHEYGTVDNLIIWQVAMVSLPPLKQVIEQILTTLPPDDAP